jgi:hypothetical protein
LLPATYIADIHISQLRHKKPKKSTKTATNNDDVSAAEDKNGGNSTSNHHKRKIALTKPDNEEQGKDHDYLMRNRTCLVQLLFGFYYPRLVRVEPKVCGRILLLIFKFVDLRDILSFIHSIHGSQYLRNLNYVAVWRLVIIVFVVSMIITRYGIASVAVSF